MQLACRAVVAAFLAATAAPGLTAAQIAAVRSEYRKLTAAEVEAHPARRLPEAATFERVDASERMRSASFGHRTTLIVKVEGAVPVAFWVEYGKSTNHPPRLFGPFSLTSVAGAQ